MHESAVLHLLRLKVKDMCEKLSYKINDYKLEEQRDVDQQIADYENVDRYVCGIRDYGLYASVRWGCHTLDWDLQPLLCKSAQLACYARSESSDHASDGSNPMSIMDGSDEIKVEMRFEPSDIQSDCSERDQQACRALCNAVGSFIWSNSSTSQEPGILVRVTVKVLLACDGIAFKESKIFPGRPYPNTERFPTDFVLEAEDFGLECRQAPGNDGIGCKGKGDCAMADQARSNSGSLKKGKTREKNPGGERRDKKNNGVRIEIPLNDILQVKEMHRKDAAKYLQVSVSKLKSSCREFGITRWPPRNTNKLTQQSLPKETPMVVNQDGVPQLASHNLPSNQALMVTVDTNSGVEKEVPPPQNLPTAQQENLDVGFGNNEGEAIEMGVEIKRGKRKVNTPGGERGNKRRTGVRIAIPMEDILQVKEMGIEDAAKHLEVSKSTLKRVCREYGIDKWPPRKEHELISQSCPNKPPVVVEIEVLELLDEVHQESQGEEVEEAKNRERDTGKAPMGEERVPSPPCEVIRHFPAGAVDEACFPLLNAIGEAHPETFEHFHHRNPIIAGGLLTTLHDMVRVWIHLQVGDFSAAKDAELHEAYRDLREIGFDLGWLLQRADHVRVVGRRHEVQDRIRALTGQLDALKPQFQSIQQQMATIEEGLARAQAEDLELATIEAPELAPLDSFVSGLLPL